MWGGGGGGLSRMHENFDLKWSQTWPLFFIFYREQIAKPQFFLCVFFNLIIPIV